MLTPVQCVNAGGTRLYLKRDDLWTAGYNAAGGKARTADLICRRAKELGIEQLCVSLDVNSSVPGMLSRVCKHHAIGLHIWHPRVKVFIARPFLEALANGAYLTPVYPGYMSVRRKRLREYVDASGGKAVELGLGLLWSDPSNSIAAAIGTDATARQTLNVLQLVEVGKVKRVVVPVGSGGMLRGVVIGLPSDVPVLGVCCGSPPDFELPHNVRLVVAGVDFNDEVRASVGGVLLDPVYEAKCAEFLREGDLLWIVAHRNTE